MTDDTPASPPLARPVVMTDAYARAAEIAAERGITLTHPIKPIPSVVPGQGSLATARSLAMAQVMVKNGADPKVIDATLASDGIDPNLRDARTPAQVRHDDAFGVPNAVDKGAFYFSLPPVAVIPDQQAFNNDVRSLAADFGMAGDRGSAFGHELTQAVIAADRDPDRAATAAKTERQLRTVFGDAGYEAKVKLVNQLLDSARGEISKGLVKELRPGGMLCGPFMFQKLATRAATIAEWRATRP